jgi:ABC-2 type transport system permease protein
MIQDILTVIWKEQKAILGNRKNRRRIILTLVVPTIAVAIVMPLQMGPDWLTTGFPLLASVVFPLAVVGTIIPNAFAGERERHTLETLLASRLSDRAILLGKLIPAVVYGWATTLVILLVGAVTVNVGFWEGRILIYQPLIAGAHVAASLLMAGLVASLGILISLRSATVQGAQQTLFGSLLIPLSLLQLVPIVLLSIVPDGKAVLDQIFAAAGSPAVVASILAGWLLVDLILLSTVIARFKRSALSLD